MRKWLSRIFWVDGLGALVVGLLVLSLRDFLAELYALPLDLVTFLAFVNLAYSPLGLTLAVKKRRAIGLVVALAVANYAWSGVSVVLMIRFAGQASVFGLGHLLLEGIYVAVLGTIELRSRRTLTLET